MLNLDGIGGRMACSDIQREFDALMGPGHGSGVTEGEASPELLMLGLLGGRSYGLEEFWKIAGAAGLDILATGRQKSGRFVVEMQGHE